MPSTGGVLELVGRHRPLFEADLRTVGPALADAVGGARFLVLGGAGSIGQATVKEIFRRGPARLHVVDLSENSLVELVRDLRSSFGYIDGDFRTFALDIGSPEFDAFLAAEGPYDYVLNLSALKHVRSERDPWTLMRLLRVNVVDTHRTARQAAAMGARKYFAVSTDKATNPVNMMGASKRVMEMFLGRPDLDVAVSTARFANVAFSDGSLLQGFQQRIAKRQPIAAPDDVRRYFITPQESGELCLLSAILGADAEIFFPRLDGELHLLTFADVARSFLAQQGYAVAECASEDEARARAQDIATTGAWPCYFAASDTTGEKDVEEFFTATDAVDLGRFASVGVIADALTGDVATLTRFEAALADLLSGGTWTKADLVGLVTRIVPEFAHAETGRYLDGKM